MLPHPIKVEIGASGNVRDENGAAKFYSDVSSCPAEIGSARTAVAYAAAVGGGVEAADAEAAYIQSELVGTPTFCILPPEWVSYMSKEVQQAAAHMRMPVFRMLRSLYGHPQAGKFWEDHLVKVLESQGWRAIEGMKSCYMNARKGSPHGSVFLCVYVDDFIMSGKELKPLWEQLQSKIKFGEPPTSLDRFLGVKHSITTTNGVLTCAFDMSDFARSCVDRYCELTKCKRDKIGHADTPCRKDPPVYADDDLPGHYSAHAPALLMKPLYLARCARPEISFAIGRLARKITRWTRKDDRECDRLYAYLASTLRFILTGSIKVGCAGTLFVRDFPDADLAGDADTARSTSGMWIELCDGEGGSFPPGMVVQAADSSFAQHPRKRTSKSVSQHERVCSANR